MWTTLVEGHILYTYRVRLKKVTEKQLYYTSWALFIALLYILHAFDQLCTVENHFNTN